MLCPYLLISINELLISIISFNDINKYGLNVKTAAHRPRGVSHALYVDPVVCRTLCTSTPWCVARSVRRPRGMSHALYVDPVVCRTLSTPTPWYVARS